MNSTYPGDERRATLAQVNWTQPRIAAALFFLAEGVAFATWAASIPRVAERLSLSSTSVSIVVSSLSLGAVATMALAGRLGDRYGAQRVCLSTGIFLPFLVPALAEANSFPLLVGLAFVYGGTLGAFDVGANAYAVAAENAEGAAWMSQMHGVWSAGTVIGSSVIALGLARHWPIPSLFCAFFVPAALIAAVRFAEPLPHVVAPDSQHARRGLLIALGVLVALALFIEGSLGNWAALFLRREERVTESLATQGYAAFAAAMLTGRIFGDGFVRRFGRARMVTASTVLAIAGTGAMLVPQSPATAIAWLVFAGLGCANLAPTLFGISGRIAAARGLGLVLSIGESAFLVGPALIGWTARITNLRIALIALVIAGAALIVAKSTTPLREVMRRAG